MATQASTAVDRRTAPHLSKDFAAELASGTVLIPVTVQDLSATGRGVIIASRDPDLPGEICRRCILHSPAVGQSTCGAMLPAALRDVRPDDGRAVHGLEARPLVAKQMHKLATTLEALRSGG